MNDFSNFNLSYLIFIIIEIYNYGHDYWGENYHFIWEFFGLIVVKKKNLKIKIQ